MKRISFRQQAWVVSSVAALALSVVPLSGCEDDAPPAAKPAAAPEFKSFKPGAGNSGSGNKAEAAGTAASGGQDSAAVKVEEGDVARLVGTTLYVLNQCRGLQIVSIADPAKPVLQARVAMTGVPREMYIDGDEAIVALSQVAALDQKEGKPLPQAGSQIRRVSLSGTAKELASVAIPGYIAATKRIGDKLVVVAPQVSWNPWWYGCWGPYGCMAAMGGGSKGGAATTDIATPGGASSSGASIAYPGGYYGGGGYNAEKTKVLVVDLANPAALSITAQLEIDGGVMLASVEIGEVLIASQQWNWKDNVGTQVERLSQIALAGDGKLTLGAQSKTDVVWKEGSSQSMLSAHRLGAGRLAVARQLWQAGGVSYQVENWKVEAGAWKKLAVWQKSGGQYGARLAVDGQLALLATSEGSAKEGTDEDEFPGTDQPTPGTDKPDAGSSDADAGSSPDAGGDQPGTDKPGGGKPGADSPYQAGIGLDVLDLSDPATISLASHTSMASGGWDLWSVQLTPLQGDNWLVVRRGARYSQAELQVLDVTDPKTPKWQGKLQIASDYGMQAEVLSSGLLAVPVLSKSGTGGQVGVQLVSLSAAGDLKARGIFTSSYTYWYQLKSLFAEKTLLRIANAGLEIVDIANLDLPKVIGMLELAVDVVDTVAVGDRLVTLVSSWQDNKFWLRVLPVGGADELKPEGQIQTDQQWGHLYAHGTFVYLANGQTVRVYDISDPKNPKARGQLTQDNNAYNYWDDGKSLWWNTWSMPQKGSTLYVIGQQVEYTKASGAACSSPSSGSGSSGGGSTAVPATDAGSATPGKEGGGSAEPMPADGGAATDPASADAGATEPEEKSDAGGYAGDCWIKPVYTTKIAALDLSNPDAPKLSKTLDLPGVGWTHDAQVSGNVLALTHYQSLQGTDGQWYGSYWLDRIDITAATAPKLMDQTNIPGWLIGLSADSNNAVTLDWQLQAGTKPEDSKVINTLNMLTLAGGKATLKKTIPLASQAGATLRQGNAVYVSTWPYWWMWPTNAGATAAAPVASELLVFDASDPVKFAQSAVLNSGAGVSGLQVAGNHLFAQTAAGLGMTVWSLSNPVQPTYKSFLPTQGGWGSRIVALGDKAYVPAGWYGISVYPLK